MIQPFLWLFIRRLSEITWWWILRDGFPLPTDIQVYTCIRLLMYPLEPQWVFLSNVHQNKRQAQRKVNAWICSWNQNFLHIFLDHSRFYNLRTSLQRSRYLAWHKRAHSLLPMHCKLQFRENGKQLKQRAGKRQELCWRSREVGGKATESRYIVHCLGTRRRGKQACNVFFCFCFFDFGQGIRSYFLVSELC